MSETKETTVSFLLRAAGELVDYLVETSLPHRTVVVDLGAIRAELRGLDASLADLRAAVLRPEAPSGFESAFQEVERLKRERDELAAALATARKTLDEERRDVDALAHEAQRLSEIIRRGGAMYRAERARMGIAGGLDEDVT